MLGHALSMKAIHRRKAKHDTIDSQHIAALRRGGKLPPASVYPAAMRATRDASGWNTDEPIPINAAATRIAG